MRLAILVSVAASVFLGTSSFTASGWAGSFYPKRIRSADYLAYYAQHFSTVEIDSTFYACPATQTVLQWRERSPDGFLFSLKAPQAITHEKVLRACERELAEFLDVAALLGNKLGPILFQFPFFSKSAFVDRHGFLDRLVPFLKTLPCGRKFAVEIRNRSWLDGELAALLRDHQIALVLLDESRMPNPADLTFDPITAEWTYIRWLGDRRAIEAQTQTWDKTIINRSAELTRWVDFCYQILKRGVVTYAYANNHYAGHAPATLREFRSLWQRRGFPELPAPPARAPQASLFAP